MDKAKEIKDLIDRIAASLDEGRKTTLSPWVSPKDLAGKINVEVTDITKAVVNSNDLVENSKGLITTRSAYKKSTPFFQQLKDSSTGIIE